MDLLERIFKNNKEWVAGKLQADPGYFEQIAKGQHPQLLYIGCSDSRVTAEDMMGLQPGEVFVHRNIANVVVPTDANLNAVVQYAVEQLRVDHIVVCGHYNCGGVKAAMNPSDLGQLNNWLQTLRDVYRLHMEELDAITDEQDRFDRLVELNVLEQCFNIIKLDHVQKRWYKERLPNIHGWVMNVRTGELKDLELGLEEKFLAIRKVYDLKPEV
jgi:carbonic anhydrase